MNRDKLHLFFSGEATLEEGMAIKAWVEASPKNQETFYKERKIFDAIGLHDAQRALEFDHNNTNRTLIPTLLKIVATVFLTLSLNYLYQAYQVSKEAITMNIVTVPPGQRTHVTLPDGTSVWLNSQSTLQYPSTFNRSHRTLKLQGEAYFDVVKNEHSPFIVQTQMYNVEVLGTQFDVKSDPSRESFETALMSGGVKIYSSKSANESVILEPHHKASLLDGRLVVTKVDDYSYYRWREGLICFKDVNFQSVIYQLEECYGMQIVINNDELFKHVFTGKFRQADGVEYALRVLQRTIRFNYSRDDSDSIIYIN
ncbi:MAG: FecR family protein [Phocaeicola sp.]